MSTQEAPNQYSLWSWLEKDLKNKSIKQKYMLKCDVKLNTNNNNQKINIQNKNAMESESKRKSETSRNDHRKRKKKKHKSTKTTRVHFNVEVQKNRISNYLNFKEDDTRVHHEAASIDPEYYGEAYTSKADGTVRIWFTNPCGIGLNHNDIKSHDSFKFLNRKSRCDIFGLSETNVQWSKLRGSSSFYSRVKNSWQEFRTVTGHNLLQDLGINQRGGNCMATVGQVSHRISSIGRDETSLGRWVWMEFSEREGFDTRVYTAYRPGGIKPTYSRNTTVYDQHERYIREHNMKLTPRTMFDKDLKEELIIQVQHKNVMVMLDANEDVKQGLFNEMMREIGLHNAIRSRIKTPMPATHHRGSRPISTIYCSRGIVTTRAGVLPIGYGVRGDHRNLFVDVQETSFLGNPMYMVVPPPMRRLKLNDSRVSKRFVQLVRKHIDSNSIMQRAEKLHSTETYPATIAMLKEMEIIDDQVGRAIQHGLRKCRTLCTGTIPYSALFSTLSKTNRLWHLVFKKKKGQKISNTTIKRLSKQVGIDTPLSLPMAEIIFKMKESKKQYESFIPHAPTERQRFYEDLASTNAMHTNQKKSTILKNIMQVESSRSQHASIRTVFPKKVSNSKKVDRVQVRKGDVWDEVTSPRLLVDALQKENREKYSCTETIPLMRPNIHAQMGNFAEGGLAKEIQYQHVQPRNYLTN